MSIAARLESLQEKVNSLAAENEGLKQRVHELNEANKQAMMTIHELASTLKKIIDEEEDEKKKQTWIDLLVNLMGKMLVIMMAGPEEADKVGNKPSEVEKKAA